MGAVKIYNEEKNMKNLKKLLVTMLALVLLICGATVVSLAADTPAEIMAEAQELLDAATKDGEFIAVRSQKMHALDKLIEANMKTIRNTPEWASFQVTYKAHQEQLKADCLAETAAALDKLLLKETSKVEAEALYAGLTSLVVRGGETSGYFDLESDEFALLETRMKVAQATVKLQIAEESTQVKDQGVALLWVVDYDAATLKNDAAANTADYNLMSAWLKEFCEAVREPLYAEVRALTDKACLPTTGLEEAQEIAAEIESYFASCYFDKSSTSGYADVRAYANYALAYAYLNQIERSKDLKTQGEFLLALSELKGKTSLNEKVEPYGADFKARYEKLLDTADASSVVARLYKKVEGYKQDVLAAFAEGYNGSLNSAEAIEALASEFSDLLSNCYFGDAKYDKDVSVTHAYAAIYDFWKAVEGMEEGDASYDGYINDEIINRNALYKQAVADYSSFARDIKAADPAYAALLNEIYESICEKAKAEVLGVLDRCFRDLEEDLSFEELRAAVAFLKEKYLTSATALYFGATEDKDLTASVKAAAEDAESRMLEVLLDLFAQIGEQASLTDDLADMAEDKIAFRAEKENEILTMATGLAFSYGKNPAALKDLASELYVSMFLTKLCQITAALEAGPDDGTLSEAAKTSYNELKTLVSEKISMVDTASEGYLLYLHHLNIIEADMGDANVDGAKQYLTELENVIDADTFDKVYALMRLDEYVRNNKIIRPDASDTTSPSALFYQEYDELVNKVKVWRQGKVDERESKVPALDYQNAEATLYDGDNLQVNAYTHNTTDYRFTPKDSREYGAGGSKYYMTYEYLSATAKERGHFTIGSLPSSTENVIIEFDITTFGTWPTSGVNFFSSQTTTLESGKALYPWIGAIDKDGQIVAPDGVDSSGRVNKKTLTREDGFIVPGQWTHFIIVYNAKDKMVSYYVNDEKIKDAEGNDAWSCAQFESYNFTGEFRIGRDTVEGTGAFSLDNVQLYIGDQPRDLDLLQNMSEHERFAYFVSRLNTYTEAYENGESVPVADLKYCSDELALAISNYWGVTEGGEDGYLFDAEDAALEHLKNAVDTYLAIAERANAALVSSILDDIRAQMDAILLLTEVVDLSKRKNALAAFEEYIATYVAYIDSFDDDQNEVYDGVLADKFNVEKEIEAYARVAEYIQLVKKFAAARDLYTRIVHSNDAAAMMASMVKDAEDGYIDLEKLKNDVAEFRTAIDLFDAQSVILKEQIIQDNTELIIACMERFPKLPEEALKNFANLKRYFIMVRDILTLADGEEYKDKYDTDNDLAQEAVALYEAMYEVMFDALQRDHAAAMQDMIDQFNDPTAAYIKRLGIYNAVKDYFETNAATINENHDAIKGIRSQFAVMEEKFGGENPEEAQQAQWEEYQATLKSNAQTFISLVTQMRFATNYAEILRLHDEAQKLLFFMERSSVEVRLAIENYELCEALLARKAMSGDAFIEAAYALKKANDMQKVYLALCKAQAAFAEADTTYVNTLLFTEFGANGEYTVEFTMAEAVETYQTLLSQYTTFVSEINADVEVVLDVVCTVRASFAVNHTMVALFKKFYD